MEEKQERPKTLLVRVIEETDPRANRIFNNPKNGSIRRWAGKMVEADVSSAVLDGFMLTVTVTSSFDETMERVRIETLSGLKFEYLEALFASAFDKQSRGSRRTARNSAGISHATTVRPAITSAD